MKFGNPEYFLFWLFLPVIIGFFIWALRVWKPEQVEEE